MNVTIKPEFVVSFTSEEFNVVGLALAGRLEEKHRAIAIELNARLMEQKAACLSQMFDVACKAQKNAQHWAQETR